MNIPELLSHLNSLEVRLRADGDRLRISAPKGALTSALQTELKEEAVFLLFGAGAEREAWHGVQKEGQKTRWA